MSATNIQVKWNTNEYVCTNSFGENFVISFSPANAESEISHFERMKKCVATQSYQWNYMSFPFMGRATVFCLRVRNHNWNRWVGNAPAEWTEGPLLATLWPHGATSGWAPISHVSNAINSRVEIWDWWISLFERATRKRWNSIRQIEISCCSDARRNENRKIPRNWLFQMVAVKSINFCFRQFAGVAE